MANQAQWVKFKKKAIQLGFDAIGVTSPNDSSYSGRFQEWLELGYEGEMGYMRRNSETIIF